MATKISRKFVTLGVAGVLLGALVLAFSPRPIMVDIGAVTREHMLVSIDEEGRTRVHDTFMVATPVAGRLLRVAVEPGDAIVGGQSVIAQMLPTNPSALDVRSEAQGRANVAAAEATLRLARAERDRAIADKQLADVDLQRARRLRAANTASESTLDRAVREARAAAAALLTAEAEIAVREAELANARALLINFDDFGPADARSGETITILAPTTGRVLRVLQKSESTLPAGEPVMEIGNVDGDLEVIVELLSSDAVQVSTGNRVVIQGWGGTAVLNGEVVRVEPWGFTKVSALGVEEQRVNTVIRFTDPAPARGNLGHGFRVIVRIVVWEDPDALIVPSSALFRDGNQWAVFVVSDGVAKRQRVDIGHNNGIQAQIKSGLEAGAQVVLYPSSALTDDVAVARRAIK